MLKPSKGFGSVDTTVIRDESDLDQVVAKLSQTGLDAPIDFIVESFVSGEMYHVDGFVYDGEVWFLSCVDV